MRASLHEYEVTDPQFPLADGSILSPFIPFVAAIAPHYLLRLMRYRTCSQFLWSHGVEEAFTISHSSKKVSPAPKDLSAEGGRLESSGDGTANVLDTHLCRKKDPQLENCLYRLTFSMLVGYFLHC